MAWLPEIPVRADALVEYAEYRDTGCEVSPSCLRCPLEVCRFDEPPRQARFLAAEDRRQRALDLLFGGQDIDTVARALQVSRRQAYRYTRGMTREDVIRVWQLAQARWRHRAHDAGASYDSA